ncbi:MAG: recombinase family protein [Lachnospiraceae bacterium]|nr:recombinase family protein [Lachnospiraceae bacterium]
MARKSRKNLNKQQAEGIEILEEKIKQNKVQLRTGAYARLSLENGGNETDDSLRTQIALVHNYINQNPDLVLTDTYVDNGYTGTNFDRPEFERMMQDACSGKIQCIVVKDLSRFGRDYLETGHYLETIFPRMNIRFIAVTDDFDNSRKEDVESLAVPIKNMVNSLYAKDISKKVTASFEARWQKEDAPLIVHPPYGYHLSEDKTKFVPDEEAASIIRVVFHWLLDGLSMKEIANRLKLIGLPSPAEWHGNYGRRVGKFVGDWNYQAVRRIAINQEYTGDMIHHKTETSLIKGYTSKKVDKEDWIIYKDHHEPIILREDFESAQSIIQENVRIHHEGCAKNAEEREMLPNYFQGKVFCGCCRKKMNFLRRHHSPGETEKHSIYFCRDKGEACPNTLRPYQTKWLMIVVMDQIRSFIRVSCDRKKLLKDMMASDNSASAFANAKKKAASLAARIAETEERKEKLYIDYTEEILDKEEYQFMKEHYISEKQELEAKLQITMEKLHRLEKKAEAFMNLANHLEKYLDCREFNQELVNELVDRIYIGKDNTLELRFKCADVYRELAECMEEMANE